MNRDTALPIAPCICAVSPRTRLCLSQATYELHELPAGHRPAADDLLIRHLRTPYEIDMVRPLRAQIDLSHNASDPLFESDEKKETSWA